MGIKRKATAVVGFLGVTLMDSAIRVVEMVIDAGMAMVMVLAITGVGGIFGKKERQPTS